MKVAQKCALGPGIGSGLGLQPRQIRAGERPRLRHKENAAHAALQHSTARLVLAPIGHLPPNKPSQMCPLLGTSQPKRRITLF